MNRYIVIQTSFEGLHRWVDAPPAQQYLADLHRHIFKVRCQVEVKHDDRELEFIAVKTELNKFLASNSFTTSDSCETMAVKIIGWFELNYGNDRSISVEVLEDGENGGLVCK